ncbi:uncharacterized protein ACNLHF_001473 isoform 2-T3 [Anomaloglossus baeobatrachus]
MKNLVALICLISTFVLSVFSSKCYSGFSRNSTTCNVSEIECLGDRCMTASQYTYNISAEDPTPNGLKCPTAYCTGNLQECKKDKEMNCTGSMNRCFEFRGDVTDPGDTEGKFSVKGCSNADCCKFNFDSAIGVSEIKKEFVNCYTLHHNKGNFSE